MFLLDIPRFKAYIDGQYMTDKHERIEAYVFAVTLLEARPLLFTVHTVDGAIYSRLPVEAIATKEKPTDNSVDRWGAISGSGCVIQHEYLKDYQCFYGKNRRGRYHCTIDYNIGGFAQDPEQHKTSNIIFGDDGTVNILPNNEIRFLDDHFTEQSSRKYVRNTRYYL